VAAVDSLPSDELRTFLRAFQRAVSVARSEPDSGWRSSVVLSDMSSFGVRSASPIVVPPAVATLFVGQPFQVPVPLPDGVAWRREAKLVLAFNNGRIDGAGAARFLRDVRRNIEEV
jgi:pyruvate/2-oxoglutarate dehydrogenase complex dihydrolipoamide acyltransferase (E2) component